MKPWHRPARQALALALFALLVVSFQLWRVGPNIVTNTYDVAAERFWSGVSPYSPPAIETDWFKYSPFFAMIYRPIGALPPVAHALFWAFLNALGLWWGVARWFVCSKRRAAWFWIALILCSMEMDGSLRYQQVNALMVGMILIGLAEYRDGRLAASGAWLCVATNFKVLPGLFLAALLVRREKQFWLGAFVAGMLMLILPALVWGVGGTWGLHREWLALLGKDVGNEGLLDLVTILNRYGFDLERPLVAWPILIVSAGILVMRRPGLEISWGKWITVGIGALLLTNPRTESPTFVLAGPLYLFLAQEYAGKPARERWLGWSVVAVAAFFITLSFNDVWPKAIWNPHSLRYATKTLGVLALWGLGVWGAGKVDGESSLKSVGESS